MATDEDVHVHGVTFRPDDLIEFTYMEARDQGVKAGLIKTLIVERAVLLPEIDELLDDIREIIDQGLRAVRDGEG